jgi:hypothetical protein
MSLVDLINSPMHSIHGIVAESAFHGDCDSSWPGLVHGESSDNFAGNWESAWIDLGGEG